MATCCERMLRSKRVGQCAGLEKARAPSQTRFVMPTTATAGHWVSLPHPGRECHSQTHRNRKKTVQYLGPILIAGFDLLS